MDCRDGPPRRGRKHPRAARGASNGRDIKGRGGRGAPHRPAQTARHARGTNRSEHRTARGRTQPAHAPNASPTALPPPPPARPVRRIPQLPNVQVFSGRAPGGFGTRDTAGACGNPSARRNGLVRSVHGSIRATDKQGTKIAGSTRRAARVRPSPGAFLTSSPASRLWRVTRSRNVRALSPDSARASRVRWAPDSQNVRALSPDSAPCQACQMGS